MDISGFGRFRPGFSSYLPGQNVNPQNPNALLRESATGQAGGGLWRRPQEPADILNRPGTRGAGERPGVAERQPAAADPPRSQPAAALSQAVSAAFDLIEDDLAGMFETLGMSAGKAKEATGTLIAAMEKAAATADSFSFNFSQAIARYARSEFAYSGSGGAVAGVSESASLNVKSLDIYVNNTTGAFSISYQEASISVEQSAIAAASGPDSAKDTGSLPGVFPGLSFGGGGDAGIASFIERVLQAAGLSVPGEEDGAGKKPADPANPARQAALSLSRQIFQAAEATITAFEPDVTGPGSGSEGGSGGGSDRFSHLRLDLSVPLGLLQRDAQGPVFEDAGGHRSHLAAPKDVGVDVDA